MGAVLAEILGALLGGGGGSAAAMPSAEAAAGGGGSAAAANAGKSEGLLSALLRRILPASKGAAAGGGGTAATRAGSVGADAAKPQINYSRMLADMGNPQAAEDEQKKSRQEMEAETEARKTVVDKLTETVPGLNTAIGLFKKLAPPFIKIPLAVGAAMFAIDKWTDHLVNSRMVLAKYNGQIAAAMARLRFQQIRQQIHMGTATAGTTTELSKAIMDFRKEFQPIKEDVRNIVNVLETGFLRLITLLTKTAKDNSRFLAWANGPVMGGIYEAARYWLDKQKNKPGVEPIPQQFLQEMIDRDKGPNRPPLAPLKFP